MHTKNNPVEKQPKSHFSISRHGYAYKDHPISFEAMMTCSKGKFMDRNFGNIFCGGIVAGMSGYGALLYTYSNETMGATLGLIGGMAVIDKAKNLLPLRRSRLILVGAIAGALVGGFLGNKVSMLSSATAKNPLPVSVSMRENLGKPENPENKEISSGSFSVQNFQYR